MNNMSKICQDAGFVLGIITKLVKIIQWAIPILLIVLIIFDLTKAMTGNVDDKAKKDAISKTVQRFIYAVIIFLLPTIVNFILLRIEPISRDSKGNITSTSTSYLGCWNYYYNK